MIVILILLLPQLYISSGQSFSNLIASDMGLAIENIGKLGTSNSETVISLILQLPNIQDNFEYYSRSEISRIHRCLKIFQDTGVHHFHPNSVMYNLIVAREKVSNYISSRRQVLKPYVIDLSGKTRAKRGILSVLGGSLLTLAFGGIAEYQIHRLKSHIEDNSDKIEILKNDLRSEKQRRLHLRQDLIGLIKADRESLVTYSSTISCMDLPFILRTGRDNLFARKSKIIDDVLAGPLEGKNKLTLTPKIIGPDILQKVVNQHPQLNNTVFKNSPHLLYSTSTISLLSIDKNLTQAHFVLYIPVIDAKDNLHNLYQTEQVGIHVTNDTCGYFELSRHLFVKNNKFYDVNLADCKQNNALHICSTKSIQNVSSCVQKDKMNCPLRHNTCISDCQFQVCKQGILFRDNSGKNAYTFDKNGYTSEINLMNSHSEFIPWKDFSAIQVYDTKLESPSTFHPSIEVANFSLDSDTLEILDPEQLSRIFSNLSSEYNTTLKMVMNPLFSNFAENDKFFPYVHQWTNTVLIIILISFLGFIYRDRLGLLCYNCITCRSCSCNNSGCLNNRPLDLELGGKRPNFKSREVFREPPISASHETISEIKGDGNNSVHLSEHPHSTN